MGGCVGVEGQDELSYSGQQPAAEQVGVSALSGQQCQNTSCGPSYSSTKTKQS